MNRIATKGLRDLLVLVVPTALLYFAEHTQDFGIPEAAIPIVGAVSLALYRLVRDWSGNAPVA